MQYIKRVGGYTMTLYESFVHYQLNLHCLRSNFINPIVEFHHSHVDHICKK